MKHYLISVFALALLGLAACGSNPTVVEEGDYARIQTWTGTGTPGLAPEGTLLAAAEISNPADICFAPDGRPYIVDFNNHRILRVDDDSRVRTVMGTGELGNGLEGHADSTSLNHPTHVAFDDQGRIILSAWHNSKVLRYDPVDSQLRRIAGIEPTSQDPPDNRIFNGDDIPAVRAAVNLPLSTAFDSSGRLYIADQQNQRIRRIDPAGGEITDTSAIGDSSMITTVVGSGSKGWNGDGPGTSVRINMPGGQSAIPVGKMVIRDDEIYFADTANNVVRKLSLDGMVTTIAGWTDTLSIFGTPPAGSTGDGGPATQAHLSFPTDIAFDSAGNLYICDYGNSKIRVLRTDGTLDTFAGQGPPPVEYSVGDGGHPKNAYLFRPRGVAVDALDNVYIADSLHHRIRVVMK